VKAARPAILGLLALALGACGRGSAPAASPAAGGSNATPVAAAGGSGAAPATPTAAPVPLRVAGSGLSGNLMGPWAAYEGGYFQQQGLAVDGVPDITSSTTAVQTLLARDIDVVNITPNAAIEASLKGAVDMPMIADLPPGAGWWLYAAPEYHSLDELRGKQVGSNQVGSSSNYAVTYAFRQRGMEAGRDYTLLVIGNQPALVAALEAGQIQAGAFSAPSTIQARRAGFVELLDLNDIPFNANGPIVRRDALDDVAGHEALLRYLKATVQAIARLRQDPAFGRQVLEKYLKIQDAEVLQEVYQAYLPKRVPLVDQDGITPVLESIAERDPSARGADPRRFYDNSLVDGLQRSGFIDALYR
jgi:ABC-type nitrate/sulfonate/bicarbonate transport system substrate-binding protein